MASAKRLSEKLGIRPGGRILMVAAPAGFSLEDLPPGATIDYAPPADTMLVFVTSKAEFLDRVPPAARSLSARGALWVGYPKGSKVDVNRDVLRELGATMGLDTIALFAIDDTWTALRFKAP